MTMIKVTVTTPIPTAPAGTSVKIPQVYNTDEFYQSIYSEWVKQALSPLSPVKSIEVKFRDEGISYLFEKF